MQLLEDPTQLDAPGQLVCVALGMFDGVHLGHQHVIRQAVIDARLAGGVALVLTFDPHPMAVVRPDRAPQLLQSLSQRLRAIEACGADATWVIPFDLARSQQEGLVFLGEIRRLFPRIASINVGQGFSFGHRRSGSVAMLQEEGSRHGFRVHALSPISIGGDVVSSTRIRQTLREGNLDHAGELLGRPYSMAGIVRQGRQLGRLWGVPTANVDINGLELPPSGVYAAQAILPRTSSRRFPSVLNLGRRPTVDHGKSGMHLEVHLLDFQSDLYGQELEVEFSCRLRGEMKFQNTDALRVQILRDVENARQYWRAPSS